MTLLKLIETPKEVQVRIHAEKIVALTKVLHFEKAWKRVFVKDGMVDANNEKSMKQLRDAMR